MERRKVSNVCGKFEPGHSISYKIACAPSEDSGQPAYLRKQVRIFLVRLKTLWIIDYRDSVLRRLSSGSEVIKLFSCSTQLNMKFSLLINMKMPTIVEKISCPALFSKKEFAIVSSLRLISRTNLTSCSTELSMKKSFITSGPDCADARVDRSLCWAHMQYCKKLCAPAHLEITF